MKLGKRWRLIIIAALVVIQLVALTDYFNDKRYLSDLFSRIAPATLPPSEQVKRVVLFLRQVPVATNGSYFLLPIFKFLRPTARQVAEYGGDCADRSRLLIVLLRSRHVKASKWALYSGDLRPKHAVVEVEVEDGKMVVDPLFGLWFPRSGSNHGYYGIKELRTNAGILRDRIEYLNSNNEQPGAEQLKFYPINEYIYQNARTINWDKSILMELIYKILGWILGEKVNEIPRPWFVEEPALIVFLGVTIFQAVILVYWLSLICLKRRRIALT